MTKELKISIFVVTVVVVFLAYYFSHNVSQVKEARVKETYNQLSNQPGVKFSGSNPNTNNSSFYLQNPEWIWKNLGCGSSTPCQYQVCSVSNSSNCYECSGKYSKQTSEGEISPKKNENPSNTKNFDCRKISPAPVCGNGICEENESPIPGADFPGQCDRCYSNGRYICGVDCGAAS